MGKNVTLKLDLFALKLDFFAVGEVNTGLERLGQMSWDQLMHKGWLHLRTNEKKQFGSGAVRGGC